MNTQASLDKIVALAKRRGFVYTSSEIYGGLANTWDYGHYGTLLKNNIHDSWWKFFVLDRDNMVGLKASIFLNPKVWEVSGHVANFTDDMIDCKRCNYRMRADLLIEDNLRDFKAEGLSSSELEKIIKANNIPCPKCGKSDYTRVRKFNLLFETKMGILEGSQSRLYLRGELAQGIFVNFKNVLNSMRVKIPFGIAQKGKVFRNEITLGQFIHRTLEFDLMEFEYFIKPEMWQETFEYFRGEMEKWIYMMGIDKKNIRWREHSEKERAHYSNKTMDMEYEYPFGFKEMFGISYRSDFDLKKHIQATNIDMRVIDPKTQKKYIPHVVEPTFGLSRFVGILLMDAYREQTVKGKTRVFLKFAPHIAPIKAAIFPLQKDEKLQGMARDVYDSLKSSFVCEFDDSGNIGKMYRRQDEIGTPFCITVDYQSLEDKTVTIRERDSMAQQRINIDNLKDYINEKINIVI